MNWKFENFKKGPVSTLIGVILMAASVYVYLKSPGSEVFSLALLTFGAVAFGIKDPKIPGTGAAMLALILMGFIAQGCVTYTKCLDKFGTLATDTVKIPLSVPFIDTVRVPVPGDTLQGTISDSLLLLIKRQGDTIRETSHSGKLMIKFWYDKYRRELEFKASLKPDTVLYIVRDTVRVVADCPPAVVFNPLGKLPWYSPAKLWDSYKTFSGWMLVAAALTFLVYTKLRRS